MAAQTLTREKDSFRIVTERKLAPNVLKILAYYKKQGDPIPLSGIVNFREWHKRHTEVPSSLWHYITVVNPAHTQLLGTQPKKDEAITQDTRDMAATADREPYPDSQHDDSGVLSTEDFLASIPSEILTFPVEEAYESAQQLPEQPSPDVITEKETPPVIQQDQSKPVEDLTTTVPYVISQQPHESYPLHVSPIAPPVQEQEKAKSYQQLLKQTVPLPLHVANKHLLPKLTREAYEKRLKTKQYRKYIPIINIKKKPEETAGPELRNRIVPHDEEYAFTIATPQVKELRLRQEEQAQKKDKQLRAIGLANPTEADESHEPPSVEVSLNAHRETPASPGDTSAPEPMKYSETLKTLAPTKISIESLLSEQPQPTLDLEISPRDEQIVHSSASADDVLRLYQDTGFAAALGAYDQTDDPDDYSDRMLAWSHAYARDWPKQTQYYALDDPILNVLTTSPESSLYPMFSFQSLRSAQTATSNLSTYSIIPGDRGDSSGARTSSSSPYFSGQPQNFRRSMPNTNEATSNPPHYDGESNTNKRSNGNENNSDNNQKSRNSPNTKRVRNYLKNRAKKKAEKEIAEEVGKQGLKMLGRQGLTSLVGSSNPLGAALLVIFFIILILLVIFIVKQMTDSQDALTNGTDVSVTFEKTGQKEVPNDTDITYTLHASAPAPANKITIHDPIPDGTEFKAATGNFTLEKDGSGKVSAVFWDLTASGNTNGIDESPTLTLHPTKQDTYIMNQATATAAGSSTVIPVTIEKKQDITQEQNGIGNGQTAKYTFTVTYSGQADDIVVSDHLSDGATALQEGSTPWQSYDAQETNTVTWHVKDILAKQVANGASQEQTQTSGVHNVNTPITLVVQTKSNDTYIFDQATATVLGAVTTGSSTTPDASISTGDTPPSTNDCNGKYAGDISKNRLLHANFGDPSCNFSKDALHKLLQQVDPTRADTWFICVVSAESGYDPTIWRDPNEVPHTPDPQGAWGLFQMGSSKPPGQPASEPGRGGILDRGDVNWELQVQHTIDFAKKNGFHGYWPESCNL